MVGMMGVGGSKEKGLEMLRNSAAHGVVTSVESRTALSLFLRHDGRYAEALEVQRSLQQQYPRDFLFDLEVANLLKDGGKGVEAMAAYKQVLAEAQKPGYFIEPRLQMAWFGLAETERGYNQLKEAAESYVQAASQPNCSDWVRKRAQMNAGQVFDLLHERGQAVKMYALAAAPGGDQTQAEAARKYMKTPYVGK
jgi:tetratricopeptide (TPR) repeat protein